jgi:hypothetical protein
VLKGIIELQKNGLFGCALIKKRRYWPAGVPGDAMQQLFDADGVNVGDNHAIAGTMDGVAYNLWRMKEPDYVMRMMASGGLFAAYETSREAVRKWMEDGIEVVRRFKYACPFGTPVIVTPSMITTTFAMVCPRLRTLGSPSDGRYECSRLFWLSPR